MKDDQLEKQIISDLKALPFEAVSPLTDNRMYQFIERKSAKSNRLIKSKRLLPYISAAAVIIILVAVFTDKKGFEADYKTFLTNPDKISFIYDLNRQELSSKDINWLEKEMKNESNPNIKITIIDLLANYQSKLDKNFFSNLESESIPTVQMAILATLEATDHIDFTDELLGFSQKQNLDNTVKIKAIEMASKR